MIKITIQCWYLGKEISNLLELELSPNGITVYQKDTNTVLYVTYIISVTLSLSTVCTNSLVTCTYKTCWDNKLSRWDNKLSQEEKLIKKRGSWIEYPKYMVNSIFLKTFQTCQEKNKPNLTKKWKKKQQPVVVYFRFPYYGHKACQIEIL